MNSTYAEGFLEQALVKVFSRGYRTVRSVAEDLNVNYHTLKHWMKSESVDKRVSLWSCADKQLSNYIAGISVDKEAD